MSAEKIVSGEEACPHTNVRHMAVTPVNSPTFNWWQCYDCKEQVEAPPTTPADSILITREQLEGFWRGAITLQLAFGVRSGECRTCDKVVKYEGASSAPILEHSANCPIPELNKTVAFLARALGEKRG